MDLRHARTFVTVVELGTVSKAALRLRIAQPALSRQISALEQELGFKLFDRAGRGLVLTGIALFAVSVLFTLVTLPVEFDASRRAALALEGGRFLETDEMTGARRVLKAAGFTYVAAAIMAVGQLLYFLLRSGLLGGGRRDD